VLLQILTFNITYYWMHKLLRLWFQPMGKVLRLWEKKDKFWCCSIAWWRHLFLGTDKNNLLHKDATSLCACYYRKNSMCTCWSYNSMCTCFPCLSKTYHILEINLPYNKCTKSNPTSFFFIALEWTFLFRKSSSLRFCICCLLSQPSNFFFQTSNQSGKKSTPEKC